MSAAAVVMSVDSAKGAFRPGQNTEQNTEQTGTRQIKAQYAEVLAMLAEVKRILDDPVKKPDTQALESRNLLTTVASRFAMHHALKTSIIYKRLAAEPRSRGIAEQFEREATNVRAAFSAFLKTYAAPSIILSQMDEFKAALEGQERALTEFFKSEERGLYPEFSRLGRG